MESWLSTSGKLNIYNISRHITARQPEIKTIILKLPRKNALLSKELWQYWQLNVPQYPHFFPSEHRPFTKSDYICWTIKQASTNVTMFKLYTVWYLNKLTTGWFINKPQQVSKHWNHVSHYVLTYNFKKRITNTLVI